MRIDNREAASPLVGRQMSQQPAVSILLVDDRPANLVALEAVLDGLGVNLVRATSGREALDWVVKEDFAAVLLDVQMPEMDGFETARRISGIERAKDTPIIFITAIHRDSEYEAKGYALGAVDYIAKPFDPAALRSEIATLVKMSKRSRAAYQLAQACHTSILEAALDAIITVDSDDRIVEWNPAAERMLGHARGDAIGALLCDLIIPASYREAHRAGFARYLSTGEGPILGKRLELAGLHADGHEFPVELAVTRIAAEGQPMFTGYMRDLTEQKRAERRRHAQYEVTRVLAQAATLDQAVPPLLRAIAQSTGWECGTYWEVVPQAAALRCVDTWHETDPDLAQFSCATRSASFASGVGVPGRVWQSGEPVWLTDPSSDPSFARGTEAASARLRTVLAFPVRIGDEVTGVMEFYTRDKHEPDEDLLRLMDALGRQMGSFVERARLFEELDTANRHKTDFLAILAHEMRTPLSAITNALYILEHIELPDHRAGQQVLTANRQTRQLARLVEDLMDISRISQGKLDLRMERIAICQTARAAADAIAPLMESRGQELRCDITPETLFVRGDAARLEQVLTNLLSNAAKYTEPGGTIGLSVQRQDGEAVVQVTDTGIGIDPPVLPQIFDMFHQVAGTESRADGGMGIGLALVRRLVEMQGGTINVRSEGTGKGTEFTVCLPLAKPDDPG